MRVAIATAFALMSISATANGQSARMDALSLQAGGPARIVASTAGSKNELTTLGSSSPASLRFSFDPSLTAESLARHQASRVGASTGTHSHLWRDAGIGFAVGAVVGAALGATTNGCCGKEDRELRAVAIVVNGLLGGAIGGLAGAFIGSRQHTEDAVPVAAPTTPAGSN
jgi:hypothetical protein